MDSDRTERTSEYRKRERMGSPEGERNRGCLPCLRIFHSDKDVTIAGEKLLNLGLCANGLRAGRELYPATPAI